MRIVVLDGYTLNPGDLSWERLEALAETCDVYDRTPPEQVVPRAEDAEVVLINKVVLSRSVLEALPALEYVGLLATGVDNVDLEAARERGLPVTNVPAYSTRSVAQMTFAHLLNLTQRVAGHVQDVRAGRWAEQDDFCFWNAPLIELAGKTMGIVGLGRIGRQVAEVARAFGMKVVAHGGSSDGAAPRTGPEVEWVGLEDLFRRSDVVSLHCPLTPETEGLVNAERLAWMKPSAFLINTARGPLVDEDALAEVLNAGRLGGAGLDVLSEEPPPAQHPLYEAENCFITPHIAWATREARARLLDTAVRNVEAFRAGAPQNVANASAFSE